MKIGTKLVFELGQTGDVVGVTETEYVVWAADFAHLLHFPKRDPRHSRCGGATIAKVDGVDAAKALQPEKKYLWVRTENHGETYEFLRLADSIEQIKQPHLDHLFEKGLVVPWDASPAMRPANGVWWCIVPAVYNGLTGEWDNPISARFVR